MPGRLGAGAAAAMLLLAGLVVAGDMAPLGGPGRPGGIELEPCDGALMQHRAWCGTLAVFENRAAASGRTIDLEVAVVPARGDSPEPDPIFYLDGGPGGAAISSFPDVAPVLRPAGVHRDIVLVNQRGTGARTDMTCPREDDPVADVAALRDCLARLPGDPATYTTAWAVDDLEQVREALGYHTVNLWGSSYGSTAAQVYAQRYPDRVRTATLVTGSLLTVPMFERMPWSSQRVFDLVAERCAAEPECHAAYPDVPGDLAAAAAQLDREPGDSRPTGAGVPPAATRQHLVRWVHAQLLSAVRSRYLPSLLHAAAQGDWEELIAVASAQAEAEFEPAWQLMQLTIACHEPWARATRAGTESWATGSYMSYEDLRAPLPEEICEMMPRPEAAAMYDPPVEVPVPVLLVNTDADPQNPPDNIVTASVHYPNNQIIIVPGLSHWDWPTPFVLCLAELSATVLDSGGVDTVDSSCLDSVPVPEIQVR